MYSRVTLWCTSGTHLRKLSGVTSEQQHHQSTTPITVRPAREADVEVVAQILTDAFAQDPWTLGHIPAAAAGSQAAADYQRRVVREHGLVNQNIDVAVARSQNGEKILGAALWSPPNAPEQSEELEALFVSSHQLDAQREAEDHGLVVAARPNEPHWHLEMLAVSPDAQGLGVGSALLSHGLQRAGEFTASLESTTAGSRRLYERHGFRLHQEVTDSRGVLQYAMWRTL